LPKNYKLNPSDLKELVSAFDEIYERHEFIEEYGIDTALALANLVSHIEDQEIQEAMNGHVRPRRTLGT